MKVPKLCFLLAALSFCVASVPNENARIVGGYATNIQKHKYLVVVRYWGSWVCGGTLVSSRHVVTAAHCVENTPVRSLAIKAGSTFASKYGKIRRVAKYWVHPRYDSYSLLADIAVLKLRRPVSGLRIAIAPLCSSKLHGGDRVTVAGWGDTTEGGRTSDRLRAVQLSLLSRKKCNRLYPGEVLQSMICAGGARKDKCQGDSGGPLMKNGQLCGVVSWGYGCGRLGNPGVYTNVNSVKGFIKSRMKL